MSDSVGGASGGEAGGGLGWTKGHMKSAAKSVIASFDCARAFNNALYISNHVDTR